MTLPRTATWGPTSGMKIDIAGFKPNVLALVAVQQQVVEIEVSDGLAAALDLDVAQAALGKRAAGSEQGIQQRAERTDGEAARLACLADDEDLDRPQLPKIHVQIEVAIDAPESGI